MYTVGIDVGGTKIAYGLFDGQGMIVEKYRRPSNANLSAAEFFDEILVDIGELLERRGVSLAELRGVGIGLPSFVDYEKGYILKTSALTNLHDFYARDYLERGLGGNVEVRLDNDAHVAALAEHRKGAGRGFPNMLYCPVSTGISSALIIETDISWQLWLCGRKRPSNHHSRQGDILWLRQPRLLDELCFRRYDRAACLRVDRAGPCNNNIIPCI